MRITSSIEYATRLMVALALEHGKAPVPAERLAESDNVPADYVSQILVKLRRAGLVTSHRGSAGGYSLSRKPEEITIEQVVRAVDGAVFEEVCERYETGTKDCRHHGQCAISPVWTRLGVIVTRYFEGVTLASILEQKAGACGAAPAWLGKPALGK
ncbi:MAG: Rrf2 family transcriptional regulator [Elusimicrobiota bacterium]